MDAMGLFHLIVTYALQMPSVMSTGTVNVKTAGKAIAVRNMTVSVTHVATHVPDLAQRLV